MPTTKQVNPKDTVTLSVSGGTVGVVGRLRASQAKSAPQPRSRVSDDLRHDRLMEAGLPMLIGRVRRFV